MNSIDLHTLRKYSALSPSTVISTLYPDPQLLFPWGVMETTRQPAGSVVERPLAWPNHVEDPPKAQPYSAIAVKLLSY